MEKNLFLDFYSSTDATFHERISKFDFHFIINKQNISFPLMKCLQELHGNMVVRKN